MATNKTNLTTGLLDSANPLFLSNFLVAYCGTRLFPLLSASVVLAWYTTDLKRFTSKDICYKYLAFKASSLFMTYVYFLVLEVFANLGRTLINKTLLEYGDLFIDPFTRTLVAILTFIIPDFFFRCLFLTRINILSTAAAYLIEDMLFFKTKPTTTSAYKDSLFLGNTNLLDVPVTWNPFLDNSLFCQSPRNQVFVRGDLGDFANESMAGKIENVVSAGLIYSSQPIYQATEASGIDFIFNQAVNAFASGGYSVVYSFLERLIQVLKSCFLPGALNFFLMYSGISPAAQAYTYAMSNAIESAELAIASKVTVFEPYFAPYATYLMNDLGIGSYEGFKEWLGFVSIKVDISNPLLLSYNATMLQTIGIQTLIIGIVVEPIPFGPGTKAQKIIDEFKDSLVQFELISKLVGTKLLAFLRSEVNRNIILRYQSVFTYNRLHSQRFIFSTLGFNTAYLDYYKSPLPPANGIDPNDAYIGNTNLKQMLWGGQSPELIENIIQRAACVNYIAPSFDEIVKDSKLYSATNPLRVGPSGLSLVNSRAI